MPFISVMRNMNAHRTDTQYGCGYGVAHRTSVATTQHHSYWLLMLSSHTPVTIPRDNKAARHDARRITLI
jgi:hypothetical protein